MFERFTEPARHVLVHAQDESRALGDPWIGAEHRLLGLLRTGDAGPAAHAPYVAGTRPQALAGRLARTLELSDPDAYAASFPAWDGAPARATGDDGYPHASR